MAFFYFYTNSQINVGGTTTFDIGNDVNIKNGVLNTDKIQGIVKGDVNIESLQDTATYASTLSNIQFIHLNTVLQRLLKVFFSLLTL